MGITFLSYWVDGHAKRDPGALSRLTGNFHLATVEQGNALNNRQP